MRKLILTLVIFLSSIVTSYALTPEEEYRSKGCLAVHGNENEPVTFVCCGICPSEDTLAQWMELWTSSWDLPGIPVEPEPDSDPGEICVPLWCDLPIQSCSLEPLTGGKDSCNQPCSKPSLEWRNCLDSNGNVIQLNFGIVN